VICSAPRTSWTPERRPSASRTCFSRATSPRPSTRLAIRTTASLVTMAASAIREDEAGLASALKGISRRAAVLARALASASRSSKAWGPSGVSRSGEPAAGQGGGRALRPLVGEDGHPAQPGRRSTGSPRSFL